MIIDPNYLEAPKKGIGKVFLTHEHDDHTDPKKIKRINDLYTGENKDFQLFGPTSIKEKVSLEPIIVENGTKIELSNGNIEVFEVECWKAKKCVAYLIEIDGKRILHSADSAKYSDRLRKIEKGVDCCFIACFEDYYEDYLFFLKAILPKMTIPYHFGKGDEQMAKDLVKFLEENDIRAKYMEIGSEITI
jgi:L-ascorbate metabolism protein UlaG (beta-lactamase superfamily)